jgi:hypothetical protein
MWSPNLIVSKLRVYSVRCNFHVGDTWLKCRVRCPAVCLSADNYCYGDIRSSEMLRCVDW